MKLNKTKREEFRKRVSILIPQMEKLEIERACTKNLLHISS